MRTAACTRLSAWTPPRGARGIRPAPRRDLDCAAETRTAYWAGFHGGHRVRWQRLRVLASAALAACFALGAATPGVRRTVRGAAKLLCRRRTTARATRTILRPRPTNRSPPLASASAPPAVPASQSYRAAPGHAASSNTPPYRHPTRRSRRWCAIWLMTTSSPTRTLHPARPSGSRRAPRRLRARH